MFDESREITTEGSKSVCAKVEDALSCGVCKQADAFRHVTNLNELVRRRRRTHQQHGTAFPYPLEDDVEGAHAARADERLRAYDRKRQSAVREFRCDAFRLGTSLAVGIHRAQARIPEKRMHTGLAFDYG